MKDKWPFALLSAALLGYAVWGLYYIDRTSFVVEGDVVHSLWDDGMISMRYARNFVQVEGL
jgi:hypothetical protein